MMMENACLVDDGIVPEQDKNRCKGPAPYDRDVEEQSSCKCEGPAPADCSFQCHLLRDDRSSALEECARRAAANPGGELDRIRNDWSRALGQTKEVSILWSSTPMRAAYSKPWFQAFLYLLGLAVGFGFCRSAIVLLQNGAHSYQYYKVIHRSHGTDFEDTPCLSRFQLLWYAVPRAVNGDVQGNCSVLWLNLSHPHEMNGFGFEFKMAGEVSASSPGLLMTGSNDEKTWQTVFDSTHFLDHGSIYEAAEETHNKGEYRGSVDLRPTFAWAANTVWAPGLMFITLFVGNVCAMYRRCNLAVKLFGGGMLVSIILNCTAALLESNRIAGLFHLYNGLVMLPYTLTVLFCERWLLPALFLNGLLDLTEGVLKLWLLPGTDALPPNHLYPGLTFMLFSAGAWLYRRRVLWESQGLVAADQARYESVWARVLAQPDAAPALHRIHALAATLTPDCPPDHVRQLRRVPPHSAEPHAARGTARWWRRRLSGLGGEGWYGAVPEVCAVESVDQLYAQASLAAHLLRRKVQSAAAASRGYLFAVDGHGDGGAGRGLVLWAEAAGDAEVRRRIRWAGVKRGERAIEKVVRCYGNEAWRLLDVCRESIVFDSLHDIAACLQHLQGDEEVVVERVKNRMAAGSSAAQSLGYRDVALNLRVTSDDARRLGVDLHVCELQLLLRDFALIKTDEGHKRYVEYRNLRAE